MARIDQLQEKERTPQPHFTDRWIPYRGRATSDITSRFIRADNQISNEELSELADAVDALGKFYLSKEIIGDDVVTDFSNKVYQASIVNLVSVFQKLTPNDRVLAIMGVIDSAKIYADRVTSENLLDTQRKDSPYITIPPNNPGLVLALFKGVYEVAKNKIIRK